VTTNGKGLAQESRRFEGKVRVVVHFSWAATLLCLVVLCGCTAGHYRRSADRSAYRAIAEKAPLVTNMEPRFTIEHTNQLVFESLPMAHQTNDFLGDTASAETGARVLSLEQALEVAVNHSRLYQDNREQLYTTALALTASRHKFTPIFSGGGSASYNVGVDSSSISVTNLVTHEVTTIDKLSETRNVHASSSVGVDWLIRDLGKISAAFTTDFFRFLAGSPGALPSSKVVATFSRPLLRNAGFKQDMETLTQAERGLLYKLRDFTRFREGFSAQIASAYYGVLGNRDAARNSFLNLQSSRKSGERTRALAAEGRTTQADLGRIEQQELSAESAWVNAVRVYQRALDEFKIQLGIPLATRLVLDDGELQQLIIHHSDINTDAAIKVALAARLDYQNVRDQLADSIRQVKLAADQLRPQLDLSLGAGLDSAPQDHGLPLPDPNRYNWNAGLNLDLPLERTLERNNYRSSLITQESSRRALEQRRDEIEQQVRDSWRTLEQAKRTYEISEVEVKLADRRVEEQELLAEFGRAKALDQVDAQNALLSSKDQRTQALVAHTIARLQFWNNMGILHIKENGQWEELDPASAGIGREGASVAPAPGGMLAGKSTAEHSLSPQVSPPVNRPARTTPEPIYEDFKSK
jgi:outer membrane protein TolC